MHTPDGAPCGLLNHLTQNCVVVNQKLDNPRELIRALVGLGMTLLDDTPMARYVDCYEVVLDGCPVGYIRKDESEKFTHKLKMMKAQGKVSGDQSCIIRIGSKVELIIVCISLTICNSFS